MALVNGAPHMSVRPGSVAVDVGNITTNFNGVDGWIIDNIIVPLAQGTLKNEVSSLVQSYIANNFNAVLDGVVGNLNISSLAPTGWGIGSFPGGGWLTVALASPGKSAVPATK